VVPAGRIRSSSRRVPCASAARTSAVVKDRSTSRRSAWKTSQRCKVIASAANSIERIDSLSGFLHADVERDAFDLGHRARQPEHPAVRNRAVGLEDDLALPFLKTFGDGFLHLVECGRLAHAVADQDAGLSARRLWLQQGQKRRGRLLDPDAVPGGGNVDL